MHFERLVALALDETGGLHRLLMFLPGLFLFALRLCLRLFRLLLFSLGAVMFGGNLLVELAGQ